MDSYLATRTNRTFGLKGGRKLTACACGAGPSALIMSFCRAFSFLYGVQVLGHREADPATIFFANRPCFARKSGSEVVSG